MAKNQVLSVEEIYSRILLAITERRLLPGARLVEERLVEVTGASRTRIRQVLGRLAHEQLVTLIPNKGACIASPTVEEAQELFYTRRLLEPGMAATLAKNITPAQLKQLQQHVALEKQARAQRDSRAIIRLSGEFHMHIAEMVASRMLLRIMRELTSFTCLIITLYDKPNVSACSDHEHADLVACFKRSDADTAQKIMHDHLLSIEYALDLSSSDDELPDFEEIFS
ncbi:GntR family transcriptional regulator [Paenalcaligenes niemegkensis]|uniref:GntR family transcriptional regulator n=1 Tax=Paenalcaligenes niemegkensis TaxID=2895469 RepID=UPI001EE7B00F|nr:GntR family transcriptional regulator [Paenalcaligenes niemegkensis]MCQ9617897.1 GntR family transcriptional regulator [Paenalcaligenes niemegkensis]